MNKKLAEARLDEYLRDPRRIERQERETRERDTAAGLTLKKITEVLSDIRAAREALSQGRANVPALARARRHFVTADIKLGDAQYALAFLCEYLKPKKEPRS